MTQRHHVPTATEAFATWATSFSGCDGGNPAGPIWFCGIEFGGSQHDEVLEFRDQTRPDTWRVEELDTDFFPYQYNQKLAKMYAALHGHSGDYKAFARARGLLGSTSDLFKMNLYPIAFQSDNDELWKKHLYDATGIPTKSIYRAWCQLHRFPVLHGWALKHRPKVIVCTALGLRDMFVMAFGGLETLFNDEWKNQYERLEGRWLYTIPVNGGQTLLAITPFLGGRSGLNSDNLLRAFGERIRERCREHFDGWVPERAPPSHSVAEPA